MRLWSQSFDKLMRNPAGRNVFREFLRTEYSEENMLFWLACEDLKQEINKSAVEEKARSIYEDYISILSPKEVGVRSGLLPWTLLLFVLFCDNKSLTFSDIMPLHHSLSTRTVNLCRDFWCGFHWFNRFASLFKFLVLTELHTRIFDDYTHGAHSRHRELRCFEIDTNKLSLGFLHCSCFITSPNPP